MASWRREDSSTTDSSCMSSDTSWSGDLFHSDANAVHLAAGQDKGKIPYSASFLTTTLFIDSIVNVLTD